MSSNNGQKGFIDENEMYLNDGNTISFGQDTATMFYQEKAYFTGDKIKILKPINKQFNKKNVSFFIESMRKAFSSFSWGSSSFNVKILKAQKIQLPVKKGKIDFEFMENFIAELEAERIAELEAYLAASGLKDYNLTKEEKQALNDFENINWEKFKFSSIFNNIKQGRRLKKEDQISGDIPFVMAGITNTGVVNYISNPIADFPKNSITIDIFGNTFFRNYSFGAGDDTGVYWDKDDKYSSNTMLFFATAMEKSLLGRYSYGKKLRSSQSTNFLMLLPSTNKLPDYRQMEILISAIQKLVIKDVVLYADKKLNAYTRVIK